MAKDTGVLSFIRRGQIISGALGELAQKSRSRKGSHLYSGMAYDVSAGHKRLIELEAALERIASQSWGTPEKWYKDFATAALNPEQDQKESTSDNA